jgi:hypothetical protein
MKAISKKEKKKKKKKKGQINRKASNSMSRDDRSSTLDYILRLSMSSSDGRVCKKKKEVYRVRRLRRHGTLSKRVTFWGRCEAAAGQDRQWQLS